MMTQAGDFFFMTQTGCVFYDDTGSWFFLANMDIINSKTDNNRPIFGFLGLREAENLVFLDYYCCTSFFSQITIAETLDDHQDGNRKQKQLTIKMSCN